MILAKVLCVTKRESVTVRVRVRVDDGSSECALNKAFKKGFSQFPPLTSCASDIR